MRLHHVAHQQLRRLSRRYPPLRHVSITTTLLTLLWVYTIYWGERVVYNNGIKSCAWENWEEWPRDAHPHHLVLIADPQLVDPHTYPGRPWPLSTLTEVYTDLYMSRNFRLINSDLDPDSIFFLGDLFDGGREWPPEAARLTQTYGRAYMEQLGILAPGKQKQGEETKVDPNAAKLGKDSKAFIPGENGRFVKWGSRQWFKDLDRFADIFFKPTQLYPQTQRELFAAYDVEADPVSVANGADAGKSQEYATSGGKSRKLVSSLPGNHDVGFGAGVQLSVRDRFESHFGSGNRVDVVGNHTIISIDTPSLSAYSQYLSTGWESEAQHHEPLTHLWTPAADFVGNVAGPAERAVSEALREYWPREMKASGWSHEVIDAHNHNQLAGRQATPDTEPKNTKPQLPVLLLSHVPFFRNPETDCGPMREGAHSIRVQFGYQYQNVLTQSLSKDLISKVQVAGNIAMIFSGDDHDYCDVIHRYNIAIPGTKSFFPNDDSLKARYMQIKEITVKSFSWAMGVRKPGFLLVSLWNPADAQGNTIGTPLPTVQTHNCLLPDQLTIFIDYGLLFLLTIPILFVQAIYKVFRHGDDISPSSSLPTTPPNLSLPRFQTSPSNGYLTPPSKSPRRHNRGTSISTSSHSAANNNTDPHHLSIQRSTNARARSVSPNGGEHLSAPPKKLTGGLIDKAGFFPQVKWIDPADEESDEESNVGGEGGLLEGEREEEDSQAKWKWRQRTRRVPGRVRAVVGELGWGLGLVGCVAGLWYAFLLKNG